MDTRLTDWLRDEGGKTSTASKIDQSKLNTDPLTDEEFKEIEKYMYVLPSFQKSNLIIRTRPYGYYSYTWEALVVVGEEWITLNLKESGVHNHIIRKCIPELQKL